MQSKNAWKAHTGHFAWPTMALVAMLATATVSLQVAGLFGWIPLWAAFLGLIPVSYGWFTPLHEAVHGNIGGSKRFAWVDTAVGWVAALAFVAPYPAFRAVHLRHHGVANKVGKDPDLWVAGSNPVSIAARCLTIVPHYYWKFVREMRHESVAMRSAVIKAVVVMFGVAVLSAFVVAQGFGVELLLLWVLPGWLASGILSFAFDWLPHHPHGETGRFTNARVIVGGPVLTVLMAAQDAHLIHHLWPKVPFYRYHAVFRETRADLEAQGAPIVELGKRRDSALTS